MRIKVIIFLILLLGQVGCGRQTFSVPTSSMIPTINSNEEVVADVAAYDKMVPARWEVVLVRMPADPNAITVRRVIGLPGETINFKSGGILVDGRPLPLPAQLKHLSYTSGSASPGNAPLTHPYLVPTNSFYVLGDNSSGALDSRFHGAIPRQWVIGRIEQKITSQGTRLPVK